MATDTPSGRQSQPHHETADDYDRVVAVLSDRIRVIACKDGIQWIIQRCDAQRSGQQRWRGVSYCTERASLLRISRTLCATIDPTALSRLKALPERISATPSPAVGKMARPEPNGFAP
ncbi:hypothetical protein HKCCSP123_16350 [Rhodobacterales bacterium HKCCSP123]|nr:hypothetical protein [Rhodobacterales bacterium HKCCSP123]